MFGLIKIKDLAKELGVPSSTVYRWKDNGDIPMYCFKHIGGTWFAITEAITAFLHNKEREN